MTGLLCLAGLHRWRLQERRLLYRDSTGAVWRDYEQCDRCEATKFHDGRYKP